METEREKGGIQRLRNVLDAYDGIEKENERLSRKETRARVDATTSAQNTSQRAQSGGRIELKLQSSLAHNDRRSSSSGKKITATNDSRIIVQASRAEENVSKQHSGRSQSEARNEVELQPSHDHNADERTGKRPSGEVTGVIDDSSAISPRFSAVNTSKKSSQRPQSGEHSPDPKYVKVTGKRSKRKRKKFIQESLSAENTSKKLKKSSEGSNLLGTQINQEEEELISTPELSQELKNHVKGIMPKIEKTSDDYSRLRKKAKMNLMAAAAAEEERMKAKMNLLASAAEAESMKAEEAEEKEKRLRQNLSTFLKLLEEKEAEESSNKQCSKPRLHEKDDGNDDTPAKEEIHQPKKVKKTKNFLDGPVTSLPKNSSIIPEEFKNRIKGLGGSESSISFVCEKVLTDADVSRIHGRILIPLKQVKNEFLTHEEDCFQDPIQKTEIEAILIDPSLGESRINLRRWLVHKDNMSLNYALINHWGHVVKKNKLRPGMTVKWWSFKKGSQLGFALINL